MTCYHPSQIILFIDFLIIFAIKTNQTYFSYCLLPNRPILTAFLILLHLTEPVPSSLASMPKPILSLTPTHSQGVSSHHRELLEHHRRVLDSQASVSGIKERGWPGSTLLLAEPQQRERGSWVGRQKVCCGKLLLVLFFPSALSGRELRWYGLSPLLIFLSGELHFSLNSSSL